MENNRRCETCNIDLHRASLAKHLRSEKHIESKKQEDMIISERLFPEPSENLQKT